MPRLIAIRRNGYPYRDKIYPKPPWSLSRIDWCSSNNITGTRLSHPRQHPCGDGDSGTQDSGFRISGVARQGCAAKGAEMEEPDRSAAAICRTEERQV